MSPCVYRHVQTDIECPKVHTPPSIHPSIDPIPSYTLMIRRQSGASESRYETVAQSPAHKALMPCSTTPTANTLYHTDVRTSESKPTTFTDRESWS
mmetsp:Transcript_18400/g.44293  ORF Transcript_18400/g.44293 Transcript_18400/m.44293 type:complete len:96 (+) Transcript_18400:16-303(+)